MIRTKNKDLDYFITCLRSNLPRLQMEYSVRSLGLFGFLNLERELSNLLKVHVDLVQKEALKPAIGKRILQEVLTV